jgi:Co/Zn/Cd efflux system component
MQGAIMTSVTKDLDLRRAVVIVALLNLAYFGMEFAVALSIGSVSLFADSVDFLEDASVNLLIALAMGWSLIARARVGMALAGLLLIPALGLGWALWGKIGDPVPPEPFALSFTGGGALLVNLVCAFILVQYRHHSGSLTTAAFLSARNDAYANVAIILAGLATAFTMSIWPDVIVGLGITAMNIDAAREVWAAAHEERDAAS